MFKNVAFVLALSGLCSCSLARADDAADKAVAFVEKFGGTVTRDEKAPGKPVIGVDLSVRREGLDPLPVERVTDAGLKELVHLKNLTTLDLGNTHVTDAGLKELVALKNLTTLDLGSTDVSDVGMKDLAALKNLTTLRLVRTKVTNAGVKELRKALPKCNIKN